MVSVVVVVVAAPSGPVPTVATWRWRAGAYLRSRVALAPICPRNPGRLRACACPRSTLNTFRDLRGGTELSNSPCELARTSLALARLCPFSLYDLALERPAR